MNAVVGGWGFFFCFTCRELLSKLYHLRALFVAVSKGLVYNQISFKLLERGLICTDELGIRFTPGATQPFRIDRRSHLEEGLP